MPLEGNAARLIVGDSCRRSNQPPADHHLAANLTVFGKIHNAAVFCVIRSLNHFL